jgi:hypothetical protein
MIKLDQKYFSIDPNYNSIDKKPTDATIILQKRMYPPFRLILHHSMGSENNQVTSDDFIVNQFSNVGYDRGYTIKDEKGSTIKRIKSLHLKPNSNNISFAQAQYALHKHSGSWCLVPLVKYPLSDICWHAGDTKWFPGTNKIHEESLGIEICGDFRFKEIENEAINYLASIFRPYSQWLKEWLKDFIKTDDSYTPERELVVWGHKDFAKTECPGKIYDQIPYLRKLLEE